MPETVLDATGTFQNSGQLHLAPRVIVPKVKRGIATLSDGSTLSLVADLQLSLAEDYAWNSSSYPLNNAPSSNARGGNSSNRTKLSVYRTALNGSVTKLFEFGTTNYYFSDTIGKGTVLRSTVTLTNTNVIWSNNRAFRLTLTADGRFVVIRDSDSAILWGTPAMGGTAPYTASWENDNIIRIRDVNNNILYGLDAGANTVGIQMGYNGNLVGYDASRNVTFQSNTATNGFTPDSHDYVNANNCASFAVGANDTIHIVTAGNNLEVDPTRSGYIRYLKYIPTSPGVYSSIPDVNTTLQPVDSATAKTFAIDIDIADGNIPIVSAFRSKNYPTTPAANLKAEVAIFSLSLSGALTTTRIVNVSTGSGAFWESSDISIAADHTVGADAYIKYAVSYNDINYSNPVTGNMSDDGLGIIIGSIKRSDYTLPVPVQTLLPIRSTTINFSTATITGVYKALTLYSDPRRPGGFVIGGAMTNTTSSAFAVAGIIDFTLSQANGTASALVQNITRVNMDLYPFYGENFNGTFRQGLSGNAAVATSFVPDSDSLVILHSYSRPYTPSQAVRGTVGTDNSSTNEPTGTINFGGQRGVVGQRYEPNRAYGLVVKLRASNNYVPQFTQSRVLENTRGSQGDVFTEAFFYYGGMCSITSGDNRNFSLSKSLKMIVMEGHRWYKAYYQTVTVGLAPRNIKPPTGSTLRDSTPLVSASPYEPYPTTMIQKALQLQFSTNPGFSDGFTTQVPSDDMYKYFAKANSTSFTDFFQVQLLLALGQNLVQGTWYVRAREYDYVLGPGPWSQSISWNISHPPVVVNMQPFNAEPVRYSANGVVFSWEFGDPWDEDIQTAYQIFVYDSSGSLVADSGKVLSSSETSNPIVIPASYNEQPMTWQLVVWDSNNVPSAGNQTFFVPSVAPAPAITSPVNNATVTTAVPVVSFTDGCQNGKTMTSAMLVITSGGVPIWSGSIQSGSSFAVPSGYLVNAKNYTMNVTVTDSIGLQSTSPDIQFATAWVLPDPPADFYAFSYDYDRRGYILCSLSASNLDPNFVNWNIYRRVYGTVGVNPGDLLTSISNLKPVNSFQDTTAAPGVRYEYFATQVANRFGDIVESLPSKVINVTPSSSRYWLFDSQNILAPICLYGVTSAPVTPDEFEDEVYFVPGRGRHLDRGDRLGASGSLEIERRPVPMSTGVTNNAFANPAMQFLSGDVVPDYWTITSFGTVGAIGLEEITPFSPSPVARPNALHITTASQSGGTNHATVIQQTVDASLLYRQPGQVFNVGAWISTYMGNQNTWNALASRFRMQVQYIDANGNDIGGPTTVVPVNDDFYIPVGSTTDLATYEALSQHWSASFTAPYSSDVAPRARISFLMGAASVGLPNLIFMGAHASSGTGKYVDGSQPNGNWYGYADMSASYGTDYYNAGRQKDDINTYAALSRPVILRSPFGDSWMVELSDNKYDPEAGTGISDIGTSSLSWIEVGY